ncbi:sensor histidine kinase [Ramlibacter albus]|uniref:histidine kinase n=1 Tax=Ramlibacter albus TaxID=2079448 RepID=A0A923S3Q1_9BURK|nr:HAMP domain-containing sensor histidine kinase [Ramlibacter albus]MBC5766656.1 HAMP domain-containing histidine kinase [Ramlibacter albus]
MPSPDVIDLPQRTAPRQSALADFLRTHSAEILAAWDEFAATVDHEGQPLDALGLRDHAAEILHTIALDLAQAQSPAEQDAKGKGLAERDGAPTPAETHADFRIIAGFAVDAMVTEYRALRASVLRIWATAGGATTAADLQDLTRFNEAIDQAIAESVARYTGQTRTSTELFIGVLGHDVRNPLGTILLSADYLVRSGQLSRAAAAPIVNAATRIRSIIEQVVDYTRAQSDGVMPIVRLPGNLHEQVAKVVQETQVRHPDRAIRLSVDGDFEGSWDEGRIGQLLSNLIGNALLYGVRDGEITVKMTSAPREVYVAVHNFGVPIQPADRERIFQPMERGRPGADKEHGAERDGLGLGLYICREIVRSHGGRLVLDSAEETGTTFTAVLPRSAARGG